MFGNIADCKAGLTQTTSATAPTAAASSSVYSSPSPSSPLPLCASTAVLPAPPRTRKPGQSALGLDGQGLRNRLHKILIRLLHQSSRRRIFAPIQTSRVCVSACPQPGAARLDCVTAGNIGCKFNNVPGFTVSYYDTESVKSNSGDTQTPMEISVCPKAPLCARRSRRTRNWTADWCSSILTMCSCSACSSPSASPSSSCSSTTGLRARWCGSLSSAPSSCCWPSRSSSSSTRRKTPRRSTWASRWAFSRWWFC